MKNWYAAWFAEMGETFQQYSLSNVPNGAALSDPSRIRPIRYISPYKDGVFYDLPKIRFTTHPTYWHVVLQLQWIWYRGARPRNCFNHGYWNRVRYSQTIWNPVPCYVTTALIDCKTQDRRRLTKTITANQLIVIIHFANLRRETVKFQ